MHVDELVVDRGVAIPVTEARGPLEGGYPISHADRPELICISHSVHSCLDSFDLLVSGRSFQEIGLEGHDLIPEGLKAPPAVQRLPDLLPGVSGHFG